MARLHATVELDNATSVIARLERLKIETVARVEVLVANGTSMSEGALAVGVLGLASDGGDASRAARLRLDLVSLGRRDAIVDVFFACHIVDYRVLCALVVLVLGVTNSKDPESGVRTRPDMPGNGLRLRQR